MEEGDRGHLGMSAPPVSTLVVEFRVKRKWLVDLIGPSTESIDPIGSRVGQWGRLVDPSTR